MTQTIIGYGFVTVVFSVMLFPLFASLFSEIKKRKKRKTKSSAQARSITL